MVNLTIIGFVISLVLVVGLLILILFKLKEIDILKSNVDSVNREVNDSKLLISESAVKTSQTFNTLRELEKDLISLSTIQNEVRKYTERLKDLFEKPKQRGNFGELILSDILDSILPRSMWKEQYNFDTGERVDFAIIYNNLIIPVDSKFPRDNYIRYLRTEEKELKEQYWNLFVSDIKKSIKSIKDKYVNPDSGTTNFALMFVPSESIYYDILTLDKSDSPTSIYNTSFKNNVVLVSPNTFYMFLNVLLMGVQNIEIEKRIKIIREKLQGINRDFSQFYSKFEEIGKSIGKINESFRIGDNHIRRFKDKVDDLFEITDSSKN